MASAGEETAPETPRAPEAPSADAEPGEERVYDWSVGEIDDEHLYFAPERGNVLFASATDGWAFDIPTFAELFARKLGVRRDVLERTLWGDYYVQPKEKRVCKGAFAKGKRPMFVQLVLSNIWEVYKSVLVEADNDRRDKIVAALGLSVAARDLRHKDLRVQLQAILAAWLPLARVTLGAVCTKLPSPRQITGARAADDVRAAAPALLQPRRALWRTPCARDERR